MDRFALVLTGGPQKKLPFESETLHSSRPQKQGPDGSSGYWWIFQVIQFMTQLDTWWGHLSNLWFRVTFFSSSQKRARLQNCARLIPSLKLTVRTWKWMVGIPSFPFGARPIFRCVLLLVSGRVTPFFLIEFATFLVVTSLFFFFSKLSRLGPVARDWKGATSIRCSSGIRSPGMRWGSIRWENFRTNPIPWKIDGGYLKHCAGGGGVGRRSFFLCPLLAVAVYFFGSVVARHFVSFNSFGWNLRAFCHCWAEMWCASSFFV